MPHLGFGLWWLVVLALFPSAQPAGATTGWVSLMPCDTGERIASRPPCLRAEGCAALEEWSRSFGAPGAQPFDSLPALGGGAAPRPSPSYCLVIEGPGGE